MHNVLTFVCSWGCVILACLMPLVALSQTNPIPNAGFENWTGNLPDDWTAAGTTPGVGPITRSDDSHAGQFAVRGQPQAIGVGVLPPVLSAGTDLLNPGIPVSERFQTLTGFLKYFPVNRDSLVIQVFLNIGFGTIGSGQAAFQDTISTYSQFSIPINYMNSGTPDRALINIFVQGAGNVSPMVETVFLLDSLQFDANATSVEDAPGPFATDFGLEQNYPNPFNPETTIDYQIAQTGPVTLTIFNLLGQEVRVLVDRAQPNGSHSVRWNGRNDQGQQVPSGVYVYRLKAGQTTRSKKMVMLQ